MADDLRTLSKRERQLLGMLDSIERFAKNYEPARDECQVSVRLQRLETVCKAYYEVREQIELLMDEDDEAKSKKEVDPNREEENQLALSSFEDRYCVVKACLLEKQGPSSSTSTSVGNGQRGDQSESFSKVKLPEIRLPSFSGNIKDWVTFRDSFRSLIHDNKQLTDMDRFSYMKSALSGEALLEIDSVELSSANYSVAWKALVTRYENKKLIVKAHLDSLFAAEGLRRESYDGLSNLISTFEKNLQMLGKIGEDTAAWSTILAYMVYSRLDPATLRHWETHHNSKDVPAYKNLMTFLRSHCSVLQSIAPTKPSSPQQSHTNQRFSKPSVCHATVTSYGKCPFCNGRWHSAFVCGEFQRLQVPERAEIVFKARLCWNCLSPGHVAQNCEKGVCHHCQQKHHSLLHRSPERSSVPQSLSNPPAQNRQQPQSKPSDPNQQTHNASTNTSTTSQGQSTESTATPQPATNTATPSTSQTHVVLPSTPTHNILLSTAMVKITDRFGKSMLARALLDSCSQHCLMTKEFSNRLKFHESPSYLSVQGIGSSTSTSTSLVSAVVSPRLDHISPFVQEMQFHVLPQLTVSLPTATCDPSRWILPESSLLADPRFYEPGPVDVIIGAEYFMDLLRSKQRKATEDGPTLQNTKFGWIVSGKIPDNTSSGSPSLICLCSSTINQAQCVKNYEEAKNRSWSYYDRQRGTQQTWKNRNHLHLSNFHCQPKRMQKKNKQSSDYHHHQQYGIDGQLCHNDRPTNFRFGLWQHRSYVQQHQQTGQNWIYQTKDECNDWEKKKQPRSELTSGNYSYSIVQQ